MYKPKFMSNVGLMCFGKKTHYWSKNIKGLNDAVRDIFCKHKKEKNVFGMINAFYVF